MDPDENERPRDGLQELQVSIQRLRMLMDACDDWLRDADDPTRYDLDPRANEVRITYLDSDDTGKPQRRKASVDTLLKRNDAPLNPVAVEPGFDDPRRLILQTARELRLTVRTAADLARMLTDERALEALRAALLTEISKADKDVAQRIAETVRYCLLPGASLSGHDALAAGDDPR